MSCNNRSAQGMHVLCGYGSFLASPCDVPWRKRTALDLESHYRITTYCSMRAKELGANIAVLCLQTCRRQVYLQQNAFHCTALYNFQGLDYRYRVNLSECSMSFILSTVRTEPRVHETTLIGSHQDIEIFSFLSLSRNHVDSLDKLPIFIGHLI